MDKTKEFVTQLGEISGKMLRISNRGEYIWRIQLQNIEQNYTLPDYSVIETMCENEFTVSDSGQELHLSDTKTTITLQIDQHGHSVPSITFSMHDQTTRALLARGTLARSYEAGLQYSVQTDADWSVLGLGEKCGSLNKKGKVWEMWNTDEPEQFADTDPLYASIPLFFHHKPGSCVGYLVNSTSRVVFDCAQTQKDRIVVSVPEADLDYCICAGSSLSQTQQRLVQLGGTISLPPVWSLGFHQSRYSYYSAMQVKHLVEEFRRRNIPCDVVHLDIHYMDYFRVFTWNELRFPDTDAFIKDLQEQHIHLITIVDPGVKIDKAYPVYTDGCSEKLFITRDNGEEYEGEVWPGPAVYPDFFNEATQQYWVKWHRELLGRGIAGIWNDMNEPANFRNDDDLITQGRSIPRATKALYKQQHIPFDSVHNAYATAMAEATVKAFSHYAPDKRPFVLTRGASFGAQRYTALWTGDNSSWWEHLAQMIPMLLNLGLSGFPFVGSDIGGFQKNANAELYTRWMAAGCLIPFFRAHSELNSENHEPWAFGPVHEAYCRSFISLRYELLPYIYTQFYYAMQSGKPVMQSLGYVYESDDKTRFIQDQYLVGDRLLVAPVLTEGVEARAVYLPAGTDWFAWKTTVPLRGGEYHLVRGMLSDLPLYVPSGSIIASEAVRMYTTAERTEALRLHVYPDAENNASGTLYIDAGEGFAYKRGDYLYLATSYKDGRCSVRKQSGSGSFAWPGIELIVYEENKRTALKKLDAQYFQTHDEVVIETAAPL